MAFACTRRDDISHLYVAHSLVEQRQQLGGVRQEESTQLDVRFHQIQHAAQYDSAEAAYGEVRRCSRWVRQVRTCVLDWHRIVTGRIRRDQHLDDVVVAVVFQVHCKSLCDTGAARPVGRRMRLVSVVISIEARKFAWGRTAVLCRRKVGEAERAVHGRWPLTASRRLGSTKWSPPPPSVVLCNELS